MAIDGIEIIAGMKRLSEGFAIRGLSILSARGEGRVHRSAMRQTRSESKGRRRTASRGGWEARLRGGVPASLRRRTATQPQSAKKS